MVQLCILGVGSFSSFNQQHINLFEVPKDFVDYSDVSDSCSVGVCMSFEFCDVVVLGWNRVFAEDQEQFDNSFFVVLGLFLDGFLSC